MWWYVFMVVCGFAVGWLGADVVRALRRPRAMPNPYAKYFQNQGAQGAAWDATDDASMTSEPHRFTRPPGWHP